MNKLIDRINKHLTERGISRNKFATLAGMEYATLARLLDGKTNPQYATLYKIGRAMHHDTQGLISFLREFAPDQFQFDSTTQELLNLSYESNTYRGKMSIALLGCQS